MSQPVIRIFYQSCSERRLPPLKRRLQRVHAYSMYLRARRNLNQSCDVDGWTLDRCSFLNCLTVNAELYWYIIRRYNAELMQIS